MQTAAQQFFFLRAALHKSFDGLFCGRWPDVERLGHNSGWHIKTSGIDSDSVVYCAGVGQDVSFELALSERFGSMVHLFDPSPTGIGTMSLKENQAAGLIFHPIGLAGESGEQEFGEPTDPAEGSFSTANKYTKSIKFDCTSLADFMREQGHDHVDLLKMDIEGSEYGVLDALLRDRLPVRMLCCEFHHFLHGYSRLTTLRCILRLKQGGYSLIHKDHHDYTFLWVGKVGT